MSKFRICFYLSFSLVTIGLSAMSGIAQTSSTTSSGASDVTGTDVIEIIPFTTDSPDNIGGDSTTNNSTSNQSASSSVNRQGLESSIDTATPDTAITMLEQAKTLDFAAGLEDVSVSGQAPTAAQQQQILLDLYKLHGAKAAIINVFAGEEGLDLFAIIPNEELAEMDDSEQLDYTERVLDRSEEAAELDNSRDITIRKTIPDVSSEQMQQTVKKFLATVTNPRRKKAYLKSSQQLYQWLIEPLEAEMTAQQVEVIVISSDKGIRIFPVAALHDGEQFLAEKYGLGFIPTFGLTDVSYQDVRRRQVIAMGASEFSEQNPLPSVPVELEEILVDRWQAQAFLNENFTLENFIRANNQNQYGVVHLATHGEFKAGKLENSYLQFYDRKLSIPEFREIAEQLGWTTGQISPIELLVMSACRTAVGDEQAELGFTGMALQAGVKSVLASLWYVSDVGTLALMSEFYLQLQQNPVKAQALQQAQMSLIEGKVRFEGDRLYLSNGESLNVPSEIANNAQSIDLSHPYYWSSFILVGNWN